MDALGRLRTGGDGACFGGIGVAIEQGSGDLRSPRVVHAGEQDGNHDALRATCSRRSSLTLTAVCDKAWRADATTVATTGLPIGVRR